MVLFIKPVRKVMKVTNNQSSFEKSYFKPYKVPYEEKQTVIPNHLIIDPNLCDADFRFLTYLISTSENFVIYSSVTRRLLRWGKTKMEKTVTKLIELGYVRRTQIREKGRFSHWEYEYHHTPIFLEKNHKKPAHNEYEPEASLSPAVESPAEKQPLPKSNYSKSIVNIKQGNDKDNDRALPSYSEKQKALEKKTTHLTTKPVSQRKFPVKKDQKALLQWLKEQDIDSGDDTFTYWISNYPEHKIREAVQFMHMENAKGKIKKTKGGFIRSVLDGKIKPINDRAIENKQFAKDFKEANKMKELEIFEKYIKLELSNGHVLDLNLDMDPIEFVKKLISMAELGVNY
jgi:predicted transcriptional regulator